MKGKKKGRKQLKQTYSTVAYSTQKIIIMIMIIIIIIIIIIINNNNNQKYLGIARVNAYRNHCEIQYYIE